MFDVFGDARWTNKDRFPDSMLRELIEHFSSQTLSLSNCPEDELGVGDEFLIKKFAESSAQCGKESLDEMIADWQKSSQELRQSMNELFTVFENI